jgi:hypothetical protein
VFEDRLPRPPASDRPRTLVERIQALEDEAPLLEQRLRRAESALREVFPDYDRRVVPSAHSAVPSELDRVPPEIRRHLGGLFPEGAQVREAWESQVREAPPERGRGFADPHDPPRIDPQTGARLSEDDDGSPEPPGAPDTHPPAPAPPESPEAQDDTLDTATYDEPSRRTPARRSRSSE